MIDSGGGCTNTDPLGGCLLELSSCFFITSSCSSRLLFTCPFRCRRSTMKTCLRVYKDWLKTSVIPSAWRKQSAWYITLNHSFNRHLRGGKTETFMWISISWLRAERPRILSCHKPFLFLLFNKLRHLPEELSDRNASVSYNLIKMLN